MTANNNERPFNPKVINLKDFRKQKLEALVPSLLVVDDDPAIRNALKRVFEKHGYSVLLASDATALRAVLDANRIKLMILDVGLPWVDGLELCTMFRRHEAYKDMPIIMLSAYCTAEDIKKGEAAGCDCYITKPFNIDELIQTVHNMLNLKVGG
jgi:DNA-binding response OmpR family regulator